MGKTVLWVTLICLTVNLPSFARAEPADSPPIAKINKRYSEAVQAANNKDYKKAVEILEKLALERPNDADVQNMLGFSYRKSGDKTLGMTHYQRALAINPTHQGALEYQGELFLELKDLKSAKANLARLEKIYGKSCAEYKTLLTAIEAFKSRGEYEY